MSEEHKLSPFFKRRIDHHKFEKMMRKGIIYMYQESNSLEEFKFKLVKATLENYIYYKYNIDIEDLPHNDVDNFIDYMVDTYEPVLKAYYYNQRKNSGNINENYSPAGKEITPNRIVIHKSNPKFRDIISNEGLKVRAGECYKIYAGYGEKCIPAIFATNSINKRASFDSTYDDDVWEIDTEMIPDVKWYKDKHYESSKKHIVTFENIPPKAIKLIHEGTGKDWGIMESVDKSEDKKLKLLTKIMDNIIFPEYKNIICGYDVKNDEAFNEPVVNVTFIGGYGTKLWPTTQGIKKMYSDVLNKIWNTIYNYINIPVGVTMETTPKCDEQENIYLRESVDKSEDKKLKFVTKMIHEFFDEVSFIKIKKYENKPLIRVYFDNDEEAANEETYFAEQIQDKIYKYTGIKLIPYWHNIRYNTDADFRLDAIKLKYDDEGNVINESEENKKEKNSNYLEIIRELIEPYKKEECVCDINVSYDDEDDMYSVYLEFGKKELEDKFYSLVGEIHYVKNLKNNVKNTIINYLSIDNLYVGSYGTKKCG
jgi:hypothetical protein